jgi:hypothetical protein
LQQNQRIPLGLVSVLLRLLAANDAVGLGGIDIRLLKQTQREFLLQNTPDGGIDSLLANQPFFTASARISESVTPPN